MTCWVDGSAQKQGEKLLGRQIISLAEWRENCDGSILVLAVSVRNQAMIERTLLMQGVTDYEIFDRSLLYKRKRLVSYSHPDELEDIILYPVFDEVAPELFWIDVGCNDPCLFSVTKLYYDMGAHGINIDPVAEYILMGKLERNRDVNLCLGVGEQSGKTKVYLNAGLSTMNKTFASQGGSWCEREVEVQTLSQICCEHVPVGQEIHLLKIDVEGLEREVIMGMNWKLYHPWVLCIESTIPGTDIPSHEKWEPLILAEGYKLAFVYGVNRYYVSREHQDLANRFLPLEKILQKYYVFHADVKRM